MLEFLKELITNSNELSYAIVSCLSIFNSARNCIYVKPNSLNLMSKLLVFFTTKRKRSVIVAWLFAHSFRSSTLVFGRCWLKFVLIFLLWLKLSLMSRFSSSTLSRNWNTSSCWLKLSLFTVSEEIWFIVIVLLLLLLLSNDNDYEIEPPPLRTALNCGPRLLWPLI